jgi:hypothetical protein
MSNSVSTSTNQMNAQMKDLCASFDSRLDQVEAMHSQHREETNDAIAAHDLTQVRHERDIEMLQRSFASLSSSRLADARATGKPWSQRTKATIGGLGWQRPYWNEQLQCWQTQVCPQILSKDSSLCQRRLGARQKLSSTSRKV